MTLSQKQSRTQTAPAETTDFEALFEQHWERLCRIVFRLVGDWDEAQDLVLEAFVRLYRRPPPQQDNLGGWLYRVATNLGLNALRARKRRQRYEEEGGALLLSEAQSGDPQAQAERALEHQRVRAVLGEMKPRLAQALVLRHAGLSYAEIAAALGLAPSSVGTLLARAAKDFESKY